ncbi:MAG: ABC transporter substrate-binding protein [Actinobacteria bacterium]|nr:MAG: ABC transporter substrate-binding protein [Actinomycetota bacterium]
MRSPTTWELLTAEDFAFAWRGMRERETITSFLMEDVESACALDDRTVEIRLREPRNYFPYILTSPWSFPWPRHKCEQLGDDWRKPENLVGNGPFVLAEFDDEHALLKPNRYWNGPRGNVADLLITFGHRGPEAYEAWREGRFDVMEGFDPSLVDAEDTIAEGIPFLSTGYFGFDATQPPFSNVLLRRAFAHAVDRERLMAGSPVRAATRGGAIPPAMPGHAHRIGLEYDLERARALLAEAGYPEGRGLPEIRIAVPEWVRNKEEFERQFGEIGARVKIEFCKVAGLHRIEGWPMWFTGWTADYPDPDGFFRGLFAGTPDRMSFYLDDDLRELLAKAGSSQDQDERMRLYHELDRLWVSEQAAIVPVWYGRALLLRRPWVHGLWTNPLSKVSFDQVVIERTREPEQLAVPLGDEA